MVLATNRAKEIISVTNFKVDNLLYSEMKALRLDTYCSGHSYKHFTIVNYDSRVVIWANL